MALKLVYQLMNKEQVAESLDRLAQKILDANRGRDIVVIGIHRRGVPMAERIANYAERATGSRPHVGVLDINLYRDDLSTVAEQPVVRKTDVPSDLRAKDVILTDDVLYTGRTVRAALDALCDISRARTIQLAVMVDRGHRELPIEANFAARTIETRDQEVVEVKFTEVDGEDAIDVMEKV